MKKVHLKGHKSAQCYMIKDIEGNIALYSYKTQVAFVDIEGWLTIFGLYSVTTRKHLSWFMKELGLDSRTYLNLYANNWQMNIHTGEIRDLLA